MTKDASSKERVRLIKSDEMVFFGGVFCIYIFAHIDLFH